MWRFIARRLMWAVFLFVAVTFITYVIFFVAPNDPAKLAAGKAATPEQVKQVAEYLNLDEPVWKQYGLWMKQLPNAPFWTAAIGVGLFMSARVAVQLAAGVGSLPRGQKMAATALGLTTAQTYRYVLLPMAYRIVLPPLTSEFLSTIKNTSVAITIGLIELTGQARAMQEFSFQVFEAFTGATVLYLLINVVVVIGMRFVERAVAVPGYISGK